MKRRVLFRHYRFRKYSATSAFAKFPETPGEQMKQIQKIKAAIGIAAILSTVFACGQEAILTADTQINSAATATNYGGATTVGVSPTTSALMVFDLTDMLP